MLVDVHKCAPGWTIRSEVDNHAVIYIVQVDRVLALVFMVYVPQFEADKLALLNSLFFPAVWLHQMVKKPQQYSMFGKCVSCVEGKVKEICVT